MEEKQDTEDLEKEVKKMLFKIATEDFGINPTPTIHNRWLWERVGKVNEAIKTTGASLKIIRKAADDVVKTCMEDGKARFPEPIIWKGAILSLVKLEKKQNVEVDDEFERANKMSLAREKMRTKVVEEYGTVVKSKMENAYSFLHPAKCMDKDGQVLYFAYWEFYEALVRQDQDAMDILNMYEKRSNRKADSKCNT